MLNIPYVKSTQYERALPISITGGSINEVFHISTYGKVKAGYATIGIPFIDTLRGAGLQSTGTMTSKFSIITR